MRVITQQIILEEYMRDYIESIKESLKKHHSVGKSTKFLEAKISRFENTSLTAKSVNFLLGTDRDWLPLCTECSETKESVIEIGDIEEDKKVNVCFDCIKKAKELTEPQDELISEILIEADSNWDGPHEVYDEYVNYYRTIVIDDWMYADSIAVVFNKGKFIGVQLYTNGYTTIRVVTEGRLALEELLTLMDEEN